MSSSAPWCCDCPGPCISWQARCRSELTQEPSVLQDELETTMKLCGVTSLRELHPGLLNTLAVDHLIPGPDDHLSSRNRGRPASKL